MCVSAAATASCSARCVAVDGLLRQVSRSDPERAHRLDQRRSRRRRRGNHGDLREKAGKTLLTVGALSLEGGARRILHRHGRHDRRQSGSSTPCSRLWVRVPLGAADVRIGNRDARGVAGVVGGILLLTPPETLSRSRLAISVPGFGAGFCFGSARSVMANLRWAGPRRRHVVHGRGRYAMAGAGTRAASVSASMSSDRCRRTSVAEHHGGRSEHAALRGLLGRLVEPGDAVFQFRALQQVFRAPPAAPMTRIRVSNWLSAASTYPPRRPSIWQRHRRARRRSAPRARRGKSIAGQAGWAKGYRAARRTTTSTMT